MWVNPTVKVPDSCCSHTSQTVWITTRWKSINWCYRTPSTFSRLLLLRTASTQQVNHMYRCRSVNTHITYFSVFCFFLACTHTNSDLSLSFLFNAPPNIVYILAISHRCMFRNVALIAALTNTQPLCLDLQSSQTEAPGSLITTWFTFPTVRLFKWRPIVIL